MLNPNLQSQIRVGCVIMAAGSSLRFGKDKLAAGINGKTMLECAFEAVPVGRLHKTVVITRHAWEEEAALSYGFSCIRNHCPEEGISRSVRLGTEALSEECGAILYMVSDQPLLRRESLAGLIDYYLAHPEHIISAAAGNRRGNPCIFPRKYFPALSELKGDTGGSAVIRSHEEDLLLFPLPEEELMDADTPKALQHIRSLIR